MSRNEQTRKRAGDSSKVLDHLALARLQDVQESFGEEMQETVVRKRPHLKDDSDSDEEDSLVYVAQKKNEETFGEELNQKTMWKSTRRSDDSCSDEKDVNSYEPVEKKNVLKPSSKRRKVVQESTGKEIQKKAMRKRPHQDGSDLSGGWEVLSQEPAKRKHYDDKGAEPLAKTGFKAGEGLGKSGQGPTEPIPMSAQRVHVGLGHEVNAYDNKGAELLAKMGFKAGEGLGKSGQGRTEPIPMSTQRGRVGLGHEANVQLARDWGVKWDSSDEPKDVEEKVKWLSCSNAVRSEIHNLLNDDWIIVDERKETIDDEDQYCDGELLKKMLEAKSVFDQLDDRDLRDARTRANPYETIGSAFFQNRAALKMANLDRVFDWLLTKERPEQIEEKNPTAVILKDEKTRILAHDGRNVNRADPLFYFADVCAGPGGFSEYVLWRKAFYNAKGYGMTLKGKDDFNLKRFTAASPVFFEPYYGERNDGDVTNPDNITSFAEVVLRGTNNNGVDLMMADGGFSVEERENIQEILSKRLYLCQFLVALSVLRMASRTSGGVFVCKLFDIFTPFSVGLIYLMYTIFERIAIHKPNTSRPANSERYIICDSPLEPYVSKVREYFMKINKELERLSGSEKCDVREVVPADIIQSDSEFLDYIVKHNESLVKRQTLYLNKYRIYAKNAGEFDRDQARLREESLRYWKIPDLTKKRPHDLYEPVNKAVARLMKQVVDFAELRQQPPPFTNEVIMLNDMNRLRFAELRMCALTEKNYSLLLLFATTDDAGRFEGGGTALRILDAALINGDDISNLPYDDRMTAADKMCEAIRITRQDDRKISPLFVAKVFSLDKMRHQLERFRVLDITGEQVAVIEEQPSTFFFCRGMRVVSILADNWVMCWSKRSARPYAYNTMSKVPDSTYSDQFEAKRCCVNFWKAIVTKIKQKLQESQKRTDVHLWHWDWTQRTIDGISYGPKAILEDNEHPVGPTWRSVYRWAQSEKAEKCIKQGP